MLLINDRHVELGNFSVAFLPTLTVEFVCKDNPAWLQSLSKEGAVVRYEFHNQGEQQNGRATLLLVGSSNDPKYLLKSIE